MHYPPWIATLPACGAVLYVISQSGCEHSKRGWGSLERIHICCLPSSANAMRSLWNQSTFLLLGQSLLPIQNTPIHHSQPSSPRHFDQCPVSKFSMKWKILTVKGAMEGVNSLQKLDIIGLFPGTREWLYTLCHTVFEGHKPVWHHCGAPTGVLHQHTNFFCQSYSNFSHFTWETVHIFCFVLSVLYSVVWRWWGSVGKRWCHLFLCTIPDLTTFKSESNNSCLVVVSCYQH